MCRAWAWFIADASAAIEEPFWYLAAGQHRKSLLFLTMLDTRKFCALLLACGLVSCKRKDDGSIRVDSSEGMWRGFWDRYQLGSGSNGPSEVTKGEFYHDALQDATHRGAGTTVSAKSRIKMRKVLVAVRIGAHKIKGETKKATLAINDKVAPPLFSPKLRSAQRRLFNSIARPT